MSDSVSTEYIEACLAFCDGMDLDFLKHCNGRGGFTKIHDDGYLRQLGYLSLLVSLIDEMSAMRQPRAVCEAENAVRAIVIARDKVREGFPGTRQEIAEKKEAVAQMWREWGEAFGVN